MAQLRLGMHVQHVHRVVRVLVVRKMLFVAVHRVHVHQIFLGILVHITSVHRTRAVSAIKIVLWRVLVMIRVRAQ